MTWTWEGIYRDSLFRSGILGQGQAVDPSMVAQAKAAAALLLDELDGEGIALPLFSIDVEFDTVVSQNKYVLGTGSDASPADAIRPEVIQTAQLRIQSGSQPVYIGLSPIKFKDYRNIYVPEVLSQPFQYSWNPKWPQGDFYLWPTPSQIWQVRLTCNVKWIDIVGNPNGDPYTDRNIYSDAELPSGYVSAFVNILALRLAQPQRLQTDEMKDLASKGKYVMSTYTFGQVPDLDDTAPGAFPWNITKARNNP